MSEETVLKSQTLRVREQIRDLALKHAQGADYIPYGWKNNLHWHVGHLVMIPRRLTLGLLGEDPGYPKEYAEWFGNGTSPLDWEDDDRVPSLKTLAGELFTSVEAAFEAASRHQGTVYTQPITTKSGIVVSNVQEALHMSLLHDGIHLGLMMGLVHVLESEVDHLPF